MDIDTEQPNNGGVPESMVIRAVQTPNVPTRAGRRGNNAPARVRRNATTSETRRIEEVAASRTLGEGQRNETTVHKILPERGDFPEDEMVEGVWKWVNILRGDAAELSRKIDELPRGTQEWYESVDELAALGDTIHSLRGLLRSDRTSSR